MRKVLLLIGVVILLLAAIVVGVVLKFGPGWYAKFGAKGEKEYASKVWTEKVTLDDRFEIQIPFAITPKKQEKNSQWVKSSAVFQGRGGRFAVTASSYTYAPGLDFKLSQFADSLFERFQKKQRVKNIEFVRANTQVLGVPALELEISGVEKGTAFKSHMLVFTRGRTGYMLAIDAPLSEEVPVIWKRMKESIRWVGPQESSSSPPRKSEPGLPQGMRRIE